MDCDVVVIGAGLAGLECARAVHAAGVDVRVLEAADAVGGRVRSERVDGFTVDRGFQLLNPAYPAVRDRVDVAALRLRTFLPAVAVRRADRLALLADPRRAPRLLRRTVASGLISPLELVALARWTAPALGAVPRMLARPDRTLSESFVDAAVEGHLRREVLEPFLAGVLAEDVAGAAARADGGDPRPGAGGETSAHFVRLLVRMFLLGTPGVPADGMGALPRQLAAGLAGRIEVERPVERLERTAGGFRVTTAAGSLAARAVVVATDPSSAVALAGVPAPRMKGLVTWWYTTDEAPLAEPVLVVDGRRRGPVVNAAVLSAVAPSYAPAGRHLVEVTCLLGEEGPPSERDARRQAGEMFGCPTAGWAVVARHVIPQALPVQPAPLVLRRDVDLGGGLFVCGDHRDTASIQGALVSGRRAGRAVVQRLRSGRA